MTGDPRFLKVPQVAVTGRGLRVQVALPPNSRCPARVRPHCVPQS